MKYRILGKSDLKASVIGQGTGQFGTPAWGYGSNFNDNIIDAVIKQDIKSGINLIDTSETYANGLSEELLGKYLHNFDRNNFILISKVAPWNLRYNDVIKAVKNSLKRLNLNYIDLYLIHYQNPFIRIKETAMALEKLVEYGYIKYIGLSNFNANMMKNFNETLKSNEIVANEIQNNIFEHRLVDDIYPYCKNNNISIISYSPLAGGLLTGSFNESNLPRDRARAFNFYNTKNYIKKSLPLMKYLDELSKLKNASISQIALSYVVRDPLFFAIPASLSVQEVIDNSKAADIILKQYEIDEINKRRIPLPLRSFYSDHYIIRPISWTKEAIKKIINLK